MAIHVLKKSEDSFEVDINNGDLIALDDIVANWKFKNRESALRFGIAILKLTNPGNLYQIQDGGIQKPLLPSKDITCEEQNIGKTADE